MPNGYLNHGNNNSSSSSSGGCGLYLAPSTIPNAGLGIFAGRPLVRGDVVGTVEPCLPILDLEWNNAVAFAEEESFPNPFFDYVWSGHHLGMAREAFDLELVTAFWPGLDAAVNCHPLLTNAERALPQYDPEPNIPLGHRSKDPAAGSSTPYAGGHSVVTRNVPAGGELFKDYGDDWFLNRGYGVPLGADHALLAQLLAVLGRREGEWFRCDGGGGSSMLPPLRAYHSLLMGIGEIWKELASQHRTSPRALEALPANPIFFEAAVFGGGGTAKEVLEELQRQAQPRATRSLEWLASHGTCLDDAIVTGPSGLSGAGRGSFATKSAMEGEVLSTNPLLAIPDKSILGLYEIGADPMDPRKYVPLRRVGSQLAANYCWSATEITVALCPYGTGLPSVNHHPSKSNARLEWPPQGGGGSSALLSVAHNTTLLTVPPNLWDQRIPRLVASLVATRPIAAGDEIFLDYGEAWEAAWNDHAERWRQVSSEWSNYVSSTVWNRAREEERHNGNGDGLLPSFGSDEPTLLEGDDLQASLQVVPKNLRLRCHGDILQRKRWSFSRLWWEGDLADRTQSPEYGIPCYMVRRKKHTWKPTVARQTRRRRTGQDGKPTKTMDLNVGDNVGDIDGDNDGDNDNSIYYEYDVVLSVVVDYATGAVEEIPRFGIPARLLRWFDKPHTTDLHLPMAFRQHPQLPADMVPDAWKHSPYSWRDHRRAARTT